MATVAGSPSWVEPLSWTEQLVLNGAAFALGGAVAYMLATAQSAAERERSARLYELHAKLKVAIVSTAAVSCRACVCLPCLRVLACACRGACRGAGRLGAQPHTATAFRAIAYGCRPTRRSTTCSRTSSPRRSSSSRWCSSSSTRPARPGPHAVTMPTARPPPPPPGRMARRGAMPTASFAPTAATGTAAAAATVTTAISPRVSSQRRGQSVGLHRWCGRCAASPCCSALMRLHTHMHMHMHMRTHMHIHATCTMHAHGPCHVRLQPPR